MNLKTFALLALAWLWAGAAFAADPQTGLTVTQGSGTNLCGFTGGSLGSQIYTCTIPVFQNGSGVGSVVSSTNGLPVNVVAGSLTGTLSPAGATSTDASGTVTTGTTYQTLQASTPTRKGCLIQNTSTHAESVKFNTTIVYLQAGSGSGDTFIPGGSFSCWTGIIVITDQIQITSPTTSAAFSAAFQ